MADALSTDISLLQEVFAKIPSAIVVIDDHGLIKKANASALQLLGEPVLEGRRWIEVITKVFRPRNDDGHEISTRDGRRLQVATLPLSQGQLVQMTDLTETRLLQDKLSHMERLSSLGRMAASLAHQIRTPLSAAMLYASNLGNAHLSPEAHKRFQEKLVNRLQALEAQVSDILMFARSNEQTVSEMDAADLLVQTANNVTVVLTRANAHLLTVAEPNAHFPILGNASALNGALSNLVANAVEAGAKNVVLKLEQVEDRIIFSVANDGPKIPEELRTKIFEPFFTSKSSGTGLGLAVVTAVTKVHQGILTLGSWPDPFATVFTISLPRYEVTAPAPAAEVEQAVNAVLDAKENQLLATASATASATTNAQPEVQTASVISDTASEAAAQDTTQATAASEKSLQTASDADSSVTEVPEQPNQDVAVTSDTAASATAIPPVEQSSDKEDVEPVQPEQAHTEPVQTDPVQTEPAETAEPVAVAPNALEQTASDSGALVASSATTTAATANTTTATVSDEKSQALASTAAAPEAPDVSLGEAQSAQSVARAETNDITKQDVSERLDSAANAEDAALGDLESCEAASELAQAIRLFRQGKDLFSAADDATTTAAGNNHTERSAGADEVAEQRTAPATPAALTESDESLLAGDYEDPQMIARRARIAALQQKLQASEEALAQVEKRLHASSLPPTAEGITKQEAVAANNATSIAFAVYAQRVQQAQYQASSADVADMAAGVRPQVPHQVPLAGNAAATPQVGAMGPVTVTRGNARNRRDERDHGPRVLGQDRRGFKQLEIEIPKTSSRRSKTHGMLEDGLHPAVSNSSQSENIGRSARSHRRH